MTNILDLNKSQIIGLNKIVPMEWDFDYESFLETYVDEDFFKAFLIIENEEVVGAGSLLAKGRVGWLGNIMVHPNFRNKGFGKLITQHLINELKGKGCKTQLLIATPMGAPLYQNFGFKKRSKYLAFKTWKTIPFPTTKNIRNLREKDLNRVVEIDQIANGEDRRHLIQKFYHKGLGYFNEENKLRGFYLPCFARGPIIAMDKSAGLALLQLKHSKVGQVSLIPMENIPAIQLLKK
ncbi:GNAT family N-acetyltransferase [Putridiphycobacter roseus]|uniref:GNAT family N-acetyltransferase n=1 Tax=Putridiphycobacter roseus TaxID=2219161 RepID=A0A2W1NP89_9FLAO|nr:GNAT family N-acetyltransferase [Putridiphycobacter roseus]PZE17452.1 GNAT family N-acetyltransferase [Putridiphycobacter roseus]